MFCRVCGNEVRDEAVFCTKCGCAIVESKKTIAKKDNQNSNTDKLFNVFRYLSLVVVSLSVMFLLSAIIIPYVHISVYTSYSYASWSPDNSFSMVSLTFAILGLILSIVNFILGFREENKEKRFSSDVIFIISIITFILSIFCACN